jgi:hypothetical protein
MSGSEADKEADWGGWAGGEEFRKDDKTEGLLADGGPGREGQRGSERPKPPEKNSDEERGKRAAKDRDDGVRRNWSEKSSGIKFPSSASPPPPRHRRPQLYLREPSCTRTRANSGERLMSPDPRLHVLRDT